MMMGIVNYMVKSVIKVKIVVNKLKRKQRSRELARREQEVIAREEVMAIGKMTADAVAEAESLGQVLEAAERLAPEGADTYQLIARHGVIEMAEVLRQGRRMRNGAAS